MVTEEILSPTTFVTEWTSIGLHLYIWLLPLGNISTKSSTIIHYYEISTFLIDEHNSNETVIFLKIKKKKKHEQSGNF